MKQGLALAAALIASGTAIAGGARADDRFLAQFSEARSKAPTVTEPGYFNAIGVPGRAWEFRSDTGFGTNRVFTERLELARACRITDLFLVVTRVGFGGAADTKTGLYLLQGPSVSLGAKLVSKDAQFWLELGPRFLFPWSSPNDSDPHALTLSRDATLSSDVADDAAWLPFSTVGVQLYLAVQTRTCAGKKCPVLFGAHYGAALSLLGSGAVQSWMGPQKGLVGNAFLELFATVPRIGKAVGFQVGAHAEASLSSIWPGSEPMPISAGPFVGWEPVKWFSARAFFGWAGPAPAFPTTMPYGVRLQFFLP